MFSNVRIEKLILSNYRNHEFLKLDLKKNIILICGKNGSGKTNILESISLLSSSSGLKKTNLTEIISSKLKGPIELFGVNLLCNINNKRMKIGLGLKKNTNGVKKIINLEGLKTKRKDEINNLLLKVLFCLEHRGPFAYPVLCLKQLELHLALGSVSDGHELQVHLHYLAFQHIQIFP